MQAIDRSKRQRKNKDQNFWFPCAYACTVLTLVLGNILC